MSDAVIDVTGDGRAAAIARERRCALASGIFRIYFNRHQAAPLVWCVATDDFELAVARVEIRCALLSAYRPKATPDDEDGKPSAWFECGGTLTLRGSTAVIE